MNGPDQDQGQETDNRRFITDDEAQPKSWSGEILTCGNVQSFACPECGSRNTAQGTFFDECRTCGWSQGY